MQQFEKKYLNTSTGERHTFRYNWRLSSYLKDSQISNGTMQSIKIDSLRTEPKIRFPKNPYICKNLIN